MNSINEIPQNILSELLKAIEKKFVKATDEAGNILEGHSKHFQLYQDFIHYITININELRKEFPDLPVCITYEACAIYLLKIHVSKAK